MTGAAARITWESRKAWARRCIVACVATAVPVVLIMMLVQGRFVLGVDPQLSRCIPAGTVFAIDRADRRLVRGQLEAMAAQGMSPFFVDGSLMIKRLAGLPGDRVVVGLDGTFVNDVRVAEGLALAKTLARPPADFVRDFVVPAGHVFLLGDTTDSYDGRYYGPVPADRLVGRAVIVF